MAARVATRPIKAKPVDLAHVAMSNKDLSLRGPVFLPGGRIEVSPFFTDEQADLVSQVVILVRLDRHPNAERKDDRPARRDERAKWRSHVWDLVNDACNELEELGQNPGVASQFANWISAKRFQEVSSRFG